MRPASSPSLLLAALVLFLFAAVGCSADDGPADGPKEQPAVPPEIIRFDAQPNPATFGEPVTLSWETGGASEVELFDGADLLLASVDDPEGSYDVEPLRTTSYLLVASNGVKETTETLEVLIKPVILELQASYEGEAAAGKPVIISWRTGGAEEVTLAAEDGFHFIAAEDARDVGSAETLIPADGTFTLTAKSGQYEIIETLDVLAEEPDLPAESPEIVSFRALPSRVLAGEAFSISWETKYAVSVELERDGVLLEEVVAPSGSLPSQMLAADTHYLLRATNAADETTERSLEVKMGLPEIVSFGPGRRNVAPAASIELSWRVEGGVALSIVGPEGALEACGTAELLTIQEGSCQLEAPPLFGSYSYELIVKNSSEDEVRAQAILQVVDGPTIDRFETTEHNPYLGELFTLSWKVGSDPDGVKPSLALRDDHGNEYPISEDEVLEGSLELSLQEAGAYVFTLTAETPDTTPAEESLTVMVYPSPSVVMSATPNPYDLSSSEQATLSWTSEYAKTLTIWELDDEGERVEPALFSAATAEEIQAGSLPVTPERSVTYLAEVSNERGATDRAIVYLEVLGPEILRFEAIPDEVVLGDRTTLTWSTSRAAHVTLDGDVGMALRESSNPLVDLSDATARPGAKALEWEKNDCGVGDEKVPGDPTDTSCPVLTFPDGFIFPYDGAEYSSARIFVDGVISFDLGRDYSGKWGAGESLAIPTAPPGYPDVWGWTQILAPYWSDLKLYTDRDRAAGLYYELVVEAGKDRHLVIHWQGVSEKPSPGSCREFLAFQVVLWEDGSFEYRYRSPEEAAEGCNGANATIGAQTDQGRAGFQLTYRDPIAGGLDGRSYLFTKDRYDLEDEFEVSVPWTRTFTLTAVGPRGHRQSKSVTVSGHPPPQLSKVHIDPLQVDKGTGEQFTSVDAGDQVTVTWEVLDATAVLIRDETGRILCAPEASTVPNGGCTFTEEEVTSHVYTVAALGALGKEARTHFRGHFVAPLRFHSLELSPSSLRADALEEVQLRWTAEGASTARVFADGVEVIHGGPFDPNSASLGLSPQRSTTYRVVLRSPDGRERTREIPLEVRTFEPFAFTQTAAVTTGDQEVTIGWTSHHLSEGHAHVTMETQTFPMVEVHDSPFIDIATTGALLPGTKTEEGSAVSPRANLVRFPESFRFPYFGEMLDEIWAATNGYLGPVSQANSNTPDYLLEYHAGRASIAPFWERLMSYGKGSVLTELREHSSDRSKDQLIVQWEKMQLRRPAPPATIDQATDDLTFQVALFRDGSIEFRYKTMSSPTFPTRARASEASIGFCDGTGPSEMEDSYHVGFQLFYKPANPIDLAGKSFRYQARTLRDTLTVRPEETTEYKICAELDGFKECQIAVVVVPDTGDLLITELALDPPDGISKQWFAIRNTTPHPFDIRGMTILADAGAHTIAGDDPIVIESGAFLVLAASDDPTLAPEYVYGPALPLGTAIDTLKIMNGAREVAKASWDSSWTMPAGKTLYLDGNVHRPFILSHDFASWCEGSADGSPRQASSCSSDYYVLDAFSNDAFIDISKTGRAIKVLEELNTTSPLPNGIGFPFPFFGEMTSDLWISSNGFLGVRGSPLPLHFNREIADDDREHTPGIIAPLWSPSNRSGRVFYEHLVIGGEKVLVVQWHEKIRFGTGQFWAPGSTTFQTQLWESGDIVHAYGYMSAFTMPQFNGPIPQLEHMGGVGTVGIEAIGGAEGIQYLHKEPILFEGLSLRFKRK